ncbi:MAG: hypothetical protein ACK5RO_12230 [Pseudobdellovibrionaceae bacterium]
MRKTFSVLVSLGLMACASGNCRSQQIKNQTPTPSSSVVEATATPVVVAQGDRVRVFKYDGSKQCSLGEVIPLEKMKAELKEIQVFKAESKSDGLMHLTVCGGSTGRAHVFEINKTQLEAAKKLGFREWTFD